MYVALNIYPPPQIAGDPDLRKWIISSWVFEVVAPLPNTKTTPATKYTDNECCMDSKILYECQICHEHVHFPLKLYMLRLFGSRPNTIYIIAIIYFPLSIVYK